MDTSNTTSMLFTNGEDNFFVQYMKGIKSMSILPQLPKRPKQLDDESLSGFLFRLFKANHCLPNSSFLKKIGITHAQLLNNEISDRALKNISLWISSRGASSLNSIGRIQAMSNITWNKKLIQKNNAKYCPVCVQEKYYHRIAWCIVPLKICTKHLVELQEGCPACQKPIQMSEFIDQHCSECSHSFCLSKNVLIGDDTLIKSQLMINGVILNSENSDLFGLKSNDFFELAFTSFLFLHGNIDFTGFSNSVINVLDPIYNRKYKLECSFNFALAFSNVYWMYSDFPNRFFKVLDIQLLRGESRMYSSFQTFAKLLNRGCYNELKEMFHRYCSQRGVDRIIA